MSETTEKNQLFQVIIDAVKGVEGKVDALGREVTEIKTRQELSKEASDRARRNANQALEGILKKLDDGRERFARNESAIATVARDHAELEKDHIELRVRVDNVEELADAIDRRTMRGAMKVGAVAGGAGFSFVGGMYFGAKWIAKKFFGVELP